MAIINGSNGAVYLQPRTGTQLLEGNINGYAAAGNGDYFAVYGPGPYAFSIIVTGDIQSGGVSSLDGGIVLGAPGIITNQGTIEGGAGILVNGYGYGGSTYLKNTGLIEGRVGSGVYTYGQGGVNNMGRIFGGSNGVDLAGGGIVTNAGTITGGTGVGDATYYGTAYVANSGVIRGTSTDGVFALGTVVNDPKATITGAQVGVNLYAGGTLTNTGGIINGGTTGVGIYGYGNSYDGDAPAAVHNTGSIGGGAAGIAIGPSHSYATNIYNAAAGRIAGGNFGIAAYGGNYGASATEIANAGLITGTSSSYGTGILLAGGGITNTGTISAAGTAGYGITASSATTIYNSGQITAAGTAIALSGGGTIIDKGGIFGGTAGIIFANGFANQLTLFTGGVINGAVNLYGTLDLTGSGQAGTLNLSPISNAATIAISTGSDWKLSGTIAPITYVFNNGTVTGPTNGVALQGGLAVYNYGNITGGTGISTAAQYVYNSGKISANAATGTGILLSAAGYIVNAASGTIKGATGVQLTKHTALYNYGFVSGVTATGAAAVYNYAGATITGTADGVFLKSGTVTDYGLIKGATYAVDFGKSATNLLAVAATATLTGGAYLGGGAIELLDNTKPGTFATANYKDFSALTIAPNAAWDIAGSLAATIAVTNDGTINDKSASNLTISGALAGTGTIDLPTALTLNGAVSSGQKLVFSGTAETLNLGDPTAFSGKLEKFAPGDTIDLTGIALANITATHFAGGVLTLTETAGSLTLTFASPKSFGSDTFSLFADGAGTGITLAAPALTPTQNSAGWISNNFVQTPSSAINLVTLQA